MLCVVARLAPSEIVKVRPWRVRDDVNTYEYPVCFAAISGPCFFLYEVGVNRRTAMYHKTVLSLVQKMPRLSDRRMKMKRTQQRQRSNRVTRHCSFLGVFFVSNSTTPVRILSSPFSTHLTPVILRCTLLR